MSLRRLKDAALRRKVRIDVVILAAALFLISGVLYVTPVETTSVVPSLAFSPTGSGDWHWAGFVLIPAGDVIACNFVSSAPITAGFANATSWQSFMDGNTSSPEFVSVASGSSGSFGVHARAATEVVLVAQFNPLSVQTFKVIVHSYDYKALRPYATLTLGVAFLALAVALLYERLKPSGAHFR